MKTKNIIKIILPVSVFLLSGIYFSCSSPTEPPPVKPIKDPRTYTWTIDTLKIGFQTTMRRIWGSAPNDVYIGGHNSGSPGDFWHYDGKKWNVVSLPVGRFYDINGIYGFSETDVWAVGSQAYSLYEDSSLIFNFDGSSWKEYPATGGRTILAVWGASPTDIWAGGWYNTLFHFDGISWKHFPFFVPPQGAHVVSISGLSSNDVYMVGARIDVVQPYDTTFYYLYHFNGSKWSVVDSSYSTTTVSARKFGAILKTIDGALYSASDKLFRKEGDSWTIINDDPLIFSLGGSSKNNLFAAGVFGTVYQYNGADWKKIVVKEGFQESIYDVWTDGTEVFMVGHDGWQTFVIHGK